MIRILDWYFNILETVGTKLSNYAWQKRWVNREQGTGYWRSRLKEVKYLSGKGK
tara:strand:+ start:76 stop:237 length:162 start_codon:yes stop_codon:yes gene_type:complete